MNLSVLLLKESDNWVAQCLEYDVATQAKTIQEAIKSFKETFINQLILYFDIDEDPLQVLEPAPKYYWDLFEKAEKLSRRAPLRAPSNCPPA